jgi:hypothetical protein
MTARHVAVEMVIISEVHTTGENLQLSNCTPGVVGGKSQVYRLRN